MEFTRENAGEANAILGCSDGGVQLRSRSVSGPVIITREAVLEGWRPPEVGRLSIADFAGLLELKPEVVLLGTGERQLLPSPALYADFAARGIGLEVMDSNAACRTYNVLMAEGRSVLAAILMD